MSEPIRVLLVDDDPMARQGIRMMLETYDDMQVVGEAADGAEVPGLLGTHPDVVLMDLLMGGVDGIEATRRLQSLDDPPQVLALTTWSVDDAVTRALAAGAAAYLSKHSGPDEIVAAIRAVATGTTVLSASVMKQLLAQVQATSTDSQTGQANQAWTTLSPAEARVARLVAQGLSNAEIGERVYSSLSTVKTQLSSIQGKLGVSNRVGIAVIVERAGQLRDERPPGPDRR